MDSDSSPNLLPEHLVSLAFGPQHFQEICFLLTRAPRYYFKITDSLKTVFEEVISAIAPKPPAIKLEDEAFQEFFISIIRFSIYFKGQDLRNSNDIMIVYLFNSMLYMGYCPVSMAIRLLPANHVLHCLNTLAIAYGNKTLQRQDLIALLLNRNDQGLTPLHNAIQHHSAIVKVYLGLVQSLFTEVNILTLNIVKTKSGESYLDWIRLFGNYRILRIYLEYLLRSLRHNEPLAWSILFEQAKAQHAALKLESQDNIMIRSLRILGSYDFKTRPELPFFKQTGNPPALPVQGWGHRCTTLFNYKVFGPELLPCDGTANLYAEQEQSDDRRLSHSLRL
jgi:hypothetical protein